MYKYVWICILQNPGACFSSLIVTNKLLRFPYTLYMLQTVSSINYNNYLPVSWVAEFIRLIDWLKNPVKGHHLGLLNIVYIIISYLYSNWSKNKTAIYNIHAHTKYWLNIANYDINYQPLQRNLDGLFDCNLAIINGRIIYRT